MANRKDIKYIIKRKMNISPNNIIKNVVQQVNIDKLKVETTLSKRDIRSQNRTGLVTTNSSSVIGNFFNENYNKITEVEYDIIICISSYNRYNKLLLMLNQLYKQSTKYRFKIILNNDGSTDNNYKSLPTIFPSLEITGSEINNGKTLYYKTISNMWGHASKYISHGICHLDDDFILCSNFIDSVMNIFFEKKFDNNKTVSIYFHKTSKENNNDIDLYRVDGGVLFDNNFIRLLEYKLNPPNHRFTINGISSGVWRIISNHIKINGLNSHRTNISLIKHDGNEDSKMHYKHRIESPIYTYDFKDDINKK